MKTITKSIVYLQITAFCIAAAFAGPAAAEKELPFRGSLRGAETHEFGATLLVDGSGTGTATHLGRFTVSWEFEVDLTTLVGIGSEVFTAANGDSIFTDAIGQGSATEIPGVFQLSEVYTITGGTGRFTQAAGTFVQERTLESDGSTFAWFEGTISY